MCTQRKANARYTKVASGALWRALLDMCKKEKITNSCNSKVSFRKKIITQQWFRFQVPSKKPWWQHGSCRSFPNEHVGHQIVHLDVSPAESWVAVVWIAWSALARIEPIHVAG